MKSILLSMLLLFSLFLNSCRVSPPPSPSEEILQRRQQRIIELESQLDGARHTRDRWQTLCLCAGVAAIALLIFGTALGAKTRHDALDTP